MKKFAYAVLFFVVAMLSISCTDRRAHNADWPPPPPPPPTLTDMLDAGLYGWVNPEIYERHFPVKPELFTARGCEVFYPDRVMQTAEIVAALKEKGYEPAGIEQLLAYGSAHPDEQREYPILALGSSWVDPLGHRYVPCLAGNDRSRIVNLFLDDSNSTWDGHFHSLAVPLVRR